MPKFASRCVLASEARALVAVATMLVFSDVVSYAQQSQQTPEARIIVIGEGSGGARTA